MSSTEPDQTEKPDPNLQDAKDAKEEWRERPQATELSMKRFEFWKKLFVFIIGMGTPEETAQFAKDWRASDLPGQCKRCEKHKQWVFNYSPIVRFMKSEIEKIGGEVDISKIKCEPCDAFRAGGYNKDLGILLCANYMRGRSHVEDTVAHELVHVYDDLKFNVNWDNLKHHACSEIRASSLSGECRWTVEAFTRNIWDFTAQHQACVRRRATISVRHNPNCKDDEMAARVINQVFESCFRDTRPFDEIYR